MFAYNEEKNILKSLNSVFENVDAALNLLYVIANGCTDNTVKILNEQRQYHPKLRVVDITLGDKCNAWNHYIHSIAPGTEVYAHFFVDSDVQFTPSAFPQLVKKLNNTPSAVAIAGLPYSGRNKEFYQSLVIDGVCLFGNLYAMEDDFLNVIREKNFKLPIGLGWIDSAITKAINCNITNQYDSIPDRITYEDGSGYTFDSLNFLKLSDIKLYINRLARYDVGKLQEQYLNELEFYEWPSSCAEINSKILNDIANGTTKIKRHLKPLIIKKLKKLLPETQ
jgi:glycosyltransferase involved in cell wall biosynthesis